ncbi:MAG: hypothetical protein R3B57_05340 [Phycisphaerales bacterium]
MTNFRKTSRSFVLGALAGAALAAPASAQLFETAIGRPGAFVNDVLDDTIWVQQNPAGLPPSVVSAGWLETTAFSNDIYVIQQDSAGAYVWDTLLRTSSREEGNEIVVSPDGYTLVAEAATPPGFPPGLEITLTRLDPFGVPIWSRRYTGSAFIGDTQGGADVYQVSDSTLVASGRVAAPIVPVIQAPVAFRTGAFGAPLWANYYFDPAIADATFGSFADIHEFRTADGEINFIATGYLSGPNGDTASRDTLVVRLDGAGVVLWSNLYRFDYGEEGLGVEVTANGEIVVTGLEHSDAYSSFMMRLKADGSLIWYKRYFGLDAVDGSVREVGGSRLVTVGVGPTPNATEALLLITDPAGMPIGVQAYGGDRDEAGDAIDTTPDGYVIGAQTDSFAFGAEDLYTLRTDFSGKTGCEQPRQVGWDNFQPQLVELQLRGLQIPQNQTWQWEYQQPQLPISPVCDTSPCPSCACEWAAPFNVCDFSDVVAFLGAFGANDPCACSLAAPLNVCDFSDVVAFLTSFSAGCP